MQFKEWGAAREGHFLEGRVSGSFFGGGGAAGSECPKMSRSPKDRERKGTPSFTLFLFLSTKILGTPKCCRPSANTREVERVGFCFKCQERTTVLAATGD